MFKIMKYFQTCHHRFTRYILIYALSNSVYRRHKFNWVINVHNELQWKTVLCVLLFMIILMINGIIML